MKIYTKMGDKGETMLATGAFVSKTSPRIEAYGSVDELNSVLGLMIESIKKMSIPKRDDILSAAARIQNDLFDLGAELATPLEVLNMERQSVLQSADITLLEQEIDRWNEELPSLRNFILPGGNEANAYSHLARTVCRRAERRAIQLAGAEPVRSEALIYLNRLSDWLFVLGRFLLKSQGVGEVLWKQKKVSP